MAIQAPEPDFGQIKCPDCDVVMKPVSLPKETDRTVRLLECPKCERTIKTDGELKVVKTLIQRRVPVDPVSLANDDRELSRSALMSDCKT
jgi:Zn-finger nucleic acid-binding protein